MTIRNLTRLCYLSVLILVISILGRYWSLIAHTVKAIPGEVHGALISGCFLFVTAILAYKYGLQTYFRQREHEQIQARYLEGGIDLTLSRAYNVSSMFLENYFTILRTLSALNSSENGNLSYEIKKEILFTDFNPLYKVSCLFGDSIVQLCLIDLYSFVRGKSNFYDNGFRELIKKAKEIPQEMENGKARAERINHLEEEIKEDFEKFRRYSFLVDDLQKVASMFEKETNLTWIKVDKFKNRDDINQIVATMKKKNEKVKY